MNYQVFTNESLTIMYEVVCLALAADDALERHDHAPPLRVRETSDWKQHAANLETEMLKRGMIFEAIDWSSVASVASL
jgi:hypothetical protein